MASIRQFFDSASRLVAGAGTLYLLGFLQNVIVARALGPSDFGVWAAVVATASLLYALLTMGLEDAFVRAMTEYHRSEDRSRRGTVVAGMVVASFVGRVITALGLVTAAYSIAHLMERTDVASDIFLIYAVAALLESADNLWRGLMRHEKRYMAFAVVPIFFMAGQFVVTLALYAGGALDLYALACLVVVTNGIRFWVFVLMSLKHVRHRLGIPSLGRHLLALRSEAQTVAPFWSLLRAGALSQMFNGIMRNADVFVLLVFTSEGTVGLYRLAKSLIEYLIHLIRLLSVAAFTDISQLAASADYVRLSTFLGRLTVLSATATILGTAILYLEIESIITFFYGVSYVPAVEPFHLLLPGLAAYGLLFWSPELPLAMERPRFYVVSMTVILSAYLALVFPAGYLLGYRGVAMVTSAAIASPPVLFALSARYLMRTREQ